MRKETRFSQGCRVEASSRFLGHSAELVSRGRRTLWSYMVAPSRISISSITDDLADQLWGCDIQHVPGASQSTISRQISYIKNGSCTVSEWIPLSGLARVRPQAKGA